MHKHLSLPLSLAPLGKPVRLVEIRDREPIRQRLAALGLTNGTFIQVIQSDPGAPLIISVKNDSRLAIGHGTAQRILVTLEY